jgi:hypothetical protein
MALISLMKGDTKALYLYIYLMDLEVLWLVGVNESTIQSVESFAKGVELCY